MGFKTNRLAQGINHSIVKIFGLLKKGLRELPAFVR